MKFQIFRVNNIKELAKLINRNINLLKFIRNNNESIIESEKIQNIKIYDIIKNTKILEEKLHFENQNLQIIIEEYQKIIEYYSAIEDLTYKVYLDKIQTLFSNEIINK